MKQELPTLPEHLNSPPVFSGVRVTRSLVLYVCFVDRCMSVCPCSFGHYVVCSSSIYRFWLPLCYLQTLHTNLYNLKLEWLLKSGNNSWMATGKMLILLISDITTLKQSSWFSCQNKNENIKFSAHDKFLEKLSSGSLKVERLESKII